jgi:hypothetical protein
MDESEKAFQLLCSHDWKLSSILSGQDDTTRASDYYTCSKCGKQEIFSIDETK